MLLTREALIFGTNSRTLPPFANCAKDGAPFVLLVSAKIKKPGHSFDTGCPVLAAFARAGDGAADTRGFDLRYELAHSRPSQTARRTGHPLCCSCRRDQKPGHPSTTLGVPSLRLLQGRVAMLPAQECLIFDTNSHTPALRKLREGRGTLCVAGVGGQGMGNSPLFAFIQQ